MNYITAARKPLEVGANLEFAIDTIELVNWLMMCGALGKNVKKVYRFYDVPASSTAVGTIILESRT
jgi:hypothetical protein